MLYLGCCDLDYAWLTYDLVLLWVFSLVHILYLCSSHMLLIRPLQSDHWDYAERWLLCCHLMFQLVDLFNE